MNEMHELLERMKAQGLTQEQAETSLSAIADWLNENYPVAGSMFNSLLRSSRPVES
jgi:hypothetical protein